MGLLVAQVLRTVAPDVTVFGRHDTSSRSPGRSACTAAAATTRAGVGRFDIVVDVTGRPEGLRRALEIVKPRGTVVMKSTFHGEAPLSTWPIVVDEVTLAGIPLRPVPPGARSPGVGRRAGEAAHRVRGQAG